MHKLSEVSKTVEKRVLITQELHRQALKYSRQEFGRENFSEFAREAIYRMVMDIKYNPPNK